MLLSSSSLLLYFLSNSPPIMNNPTPHHMTARKMKIIGMLSPRLGQVCMAKRYRMAKKMSPTREHLEKAKDQPPCRLPPRRDRSRSSPGANAAPPTLGTP